MKPMDRVIIEREIDALLVAAPEMADDEQLRHDMIAAETDLFEMINVLVRRIGTCEAFAAGLSGYVNDIRERQARYERKSEALRNLIRKLMEHANLSKAELDAATVSVRRGHPKVIITDESALPADCLRIVKTPDRALIKSYLDAGQEVPGAALSNAEPSLAIRVK